MGEKQRIHLTETSVARLQLPKGKNDATWFDDETRGFGVRKRGDSAVYILQYQLRGQTSKLTLGKCSEIKCDVARAMAEAKRDEISKARLGLAIDPATARDNAKIEAQKPKPETIKAVIADYLEAIRAKKRPRTYQGIKRHLENFWTPLHGHYVNSVTRADVATELRKLAKRGPVVANRCRADLSAFFKWAIGGGLCDSNPVVGTNKQDENAPRERSLSDAEAAAMWLAVPQGDYGHILKLLLLTGCRRDEIGGLRWSEIDLEARTITIPEIRTKNHNEHVIPLTASAIAVLNDIPHRAERDYVFGTNRDGGFSNWSRAKVGFDEKLKFTQDWTVHDIRRTVRTGLGKLGVVPHVAEAVLNHLPAKLIRTYDRHSYAEEKKAALQAWANHLMTITLPEKAKPISVRAVPNKQTEPETPRATFADRLAASAKKERRDLH
jgi:integrase